MFYPFPHFPPAKIMISFICVLIHGFRKHLLTVTVIQALGKKEGETWPLPHSLVGNKSNKNKQAFFQIKTFGTCPKKVKQTSTIQYDEGHLSSEWILCKEEGHEPRLGIREGSVELVIMLLRTPECEWTLTSWSRGDTSSRRSGTFDSLWYTLGSSLFSLGP